MKRVKLFEEFVNESSSVDATILNTLAGNQVGTEPAAEFLAQHDIDLESLKKAKMQGVITQYEIRDIVNGKATENAIEKFIKDYTNETH